MPKWISRSKWQNLVVRVRHLVAVSVCLATTALSLTGTFGLVDSAAYGAVVFASPPPGSPLNNAASIEPTTAEMCATSTPNKPFTFAPNFAGDAEPGSVVSLPKGYQQYLYVGSDSGNNSQGSITWRSDLSVGAAVSGDPSISIGRDTQNAGSFLSGTDSSVAIAGIGIANYSVAGTFTSSVSRVGPGSNGGGPDLAVGPSVSLQYSVPASNDVVVVLVGGQGAGLDQVSGATLATLVNDTYSECGSDVIASVAMFAGSPGQGIFTTTFNSSTYLSNAGTSLGAVAYVLSPNPTTQPGPPVNVAVVTGNDHAEVTWNAPASDGGDPISKYTVIVTPGTKTCTLDPRKSAALACTVRGLANGKHYSLKVIASNVLGQGPASSSLDDVMPQSAGHTKIIFSDGFSGTRLSPAWTAVNGTNSSNNELECYSPGNVSVAGGLLKEFALQSSSCDFNCPPTSNVPCPYSSGAVYWKSFAFTYGTVSVRAKFAGGVGTWPAVWLLGQNCQQPSWMASNCNWPTPGSDEIDIAEILNSNHNRVNEQIHTVASNGLSVSTQCYPKASNVSTKWHVYTLIWAPNSLIWQIDGITTCQMSASIPATPMFLIINTAVGGTGVTRVVGSTLPKVSEMDYVRVTQPISASS